MTESNLFGSLLTLGMKEFLKYLHLQETILIKLHADENFSLMVKLNV